ncbi:MAG: SGNH/GDSL hydrolase family protein [Candidatus Omnitrophica bacterium]|nr:SGNH/GDSL hydrolase family protein [Candidatus Omnitrophota bacterium]
MKAVLQGFFRVFLFLLFFESFLHIGGGVFLLMQSLTDNSGEIASVRTVKNECVILVMGDSLTSGGGINSYPRILERILNEKGTGVHFVVINRGAPGRSTLNLVSDVGPFIEKYNPDIVVTLMGMVDVNVANNEANSAYQKLKVFFAENVKIFRFAKRLLDPLRPDLQLRTAAEMKKLNLWADDEDRRLFKEQQVKGGNAADVLDYDSLPETTVGSVLKVKDAGKAERTLEALLHPPPFTVDGFNDFVEVVKRHGKRLVIAQYPQISLAPLERIIKLKKDIVFVENVDNFRDAIRVNGMAAYFGDLVTPVFGHGSPAGNRLIAESLAQAILPLVVRSRNP